MDKKLKYYDLMEDLRKQIVSGKIKPGEKLPSENELSGTYQVSRQTVRKALQILQNEGYIYAEHGRGTFCSEMARRTGETKNIAVVTTYLSDYIFPRVIQGIDKVLTENGYSILLKNTRNSRNMEAKCLEELLQKGIDGLIIEPSKSQIFCKHINLYQTLDEYRIPYVFIQGSFPLFKSSVLVCGGAVPASKAPNIVCPDSARSIRRNTSAISIPYFSIKARKPQEIFKRTEKLHRKKLPGDGYPSPGSLCPLRSALVHCTFSRAVSPPRLRVPLLIPPAVRRTPAPQPLQG